MQLYFLKLERELFEDSLLIVRSCAFDQSVYILDQGDSREAAGCVMDFGINRI